jgi:hypothetical protein
MAANSSDFADDPAMLRNLACGVDITVSVYRATVFDVDD